MAMTCPRCEINVPDEALYCPYCNLPKPKSGFVDPAKHGPDENKTPTESKLPMTPKKTRAAVSYASSRATRPARRLRLPVLIGAALVALLCVGAYMYVLPLIRSDGADPKTVLSTLDKFRRMPSNDPSLTIEARMTRELEESRRAGTLVGYQGWTARAVKGDQTKVVLAFSYQQAGGVQGRAEWVANLNDNTFTPKTELAAAVYGKQ